MWKKVLCNDKTIKYVNVNGEKQCVTACASTMYLIWFQSTATDVQTEVEILYFQLSTFIYI